MVEYLPNIQYSLDGETFNDYNSDEVIDFENTLYIQWEGALFNNATLGSLELHGENIKVSGRLLHGDTPHAYRGLFSHCNDITDASELVLSSETVGEYAYSEMFSGCRNLTTVPELSATILAEGCYSHMFQYCTSLTSVPELPATTLEPYCYDSMFSFCTSLTTVPTLIDTNLKNINKIMELNTCKVSVITTVYNVGDYLKTCIDSILNQTLQDIELILFSFFTVTIAVCQSII
jgi:hypothetical protein